MLVKRPWGLMLKLIHTQHFWLKIIKVNKGCRTSLQYHEQRNEYHFGWNYYKTISPFEKHRMKEGFYVEIATGNPKEDDIIRIEDDYNRI